MNVKNVIKKVLLTVPYEDWHMKSLIEALYPAECIIANMSDNKKIEDALSFVDVAILGADLDIRYTEAPNLKWVHCDHSGLNKSALQEVFKKDLIVTGSAGRSTPVLAEHAIFFLLSFTYRIMDLIKSKETHDWDCVDRYVNNRGLFGKTIGIIGLGNTGAELAKRAHGFGMNVSGYSRSNKKNPNVDKMFSYDNNDSLDELLSKSDFVVLTVRLSDETFHLIGDRELKLMKKTAYLINIARGSVIDEIALINALKNNVIAGAGLDTFEIEPLQKNNPLWGLSNTLITPHCTPEVPDLKAESLKIIIQNIENYKNNKPMINRLIERDVFSKKVENLK